MCQHTNTALKVTNWVENHTDQGWSRLLRKLVLSHVDIHCIYHCHIVSLVWQLDEMCISFDGGKTTLNFAEAALLIQGSACIYSKKVRSCLVEKKNIIGWFHIIFLTCCPKVTVIHDNSFDLNCGITTLLLAP